MTDYTSNYGIAKPDFDSAPWHTQMHNALDLIDAIIYSALAVTAVTGLWANSTAYTTGDRVVDGDDGTIWTCASDHTSASSGTFAADRTANPSYWTSDTLQLSARGAWANDTVYNKYDIVYDQSEGVSAICDVTHTSSSAPDTIRDDAANWTFIIDLNVAGGAASSITYDNSSSGLTATDVQDAIDELDTALDAQSVSLAAKAPLASPALTGNPTAPSQAGSDDSTKIATTAMVQDAVDIHETAVTAALALKAPLASPALTGNPTAPTQSAAEDSTKIATTEHVHDAIAADIATWWAAVGGRCNIRFYTAGDTWTKPSGLVSAMVWVVAGGGGGGGAVSTSSNNGGGGGGGAAAWEHFAEATLGASETVTVGAGGSGGAAGDNPGSAGGTSSFGAHIVCTGGGGGGKASTGGAGSGGTTTDGDVYDDGDDGSAGGGSGEGGGDAGLFGNLYNALHSLLSGGAFGAGLPAGNEGGDGYLYGGGAGGADGNGADNLAGGDGGDGAIMVWEFF